MKIKKISSKQKTIKKTFFLCNHFSVNRGFCKLKDKFFSDCIGNDKKCSSYIIKITN
jgi:hypothetical protein